MNQQELYPGSCGAIRDQLLQDWQRSNEVTIRREDYDYILATLSTASFYCGADPVVTCATIQVSQRAAIKMLEQYA